MNKLYIEVKRNNSYVWVKFNILTHNELLLEDISNIMNQYLINTYPTEVFFKYPNVLFKKVNNSIYKNYDKDSCIRTISILDSVIPFTEYNCKTYLDLKQKLIGYMKGE